MGGWQKLRVLNFDLALTLDSGQFFRYQKEDEHYLVLTQKRVIRLFQDGNVLHFQGADTKFIKNFFSLDKKHERQIGRLAEDSMLRPLISRYMGLRIMRQDLHEAILGFICSSNSNIQRIKTNLNVMAEECGTLRGTYSFLPPPGKPLKKTMLEKVKLGYRTAYIENASKIINKRMLDEIREMDYEESHKALIALPGVGPKVADCICLFALGHGEAFPVDTHVIRAMRSFFPGISSEKEARDFAQRRWGKDAGLAQQFIFQWARETR